MNILIKPSEFGKFLREKRKIAGLTQDELASSIKKTGQYISNIEKGKNNAPPNISDIEILIKKLNLVAIDAKEFKLLAAADRNRLSNTQMSYLFNHKSLLALIDYGIENELNDTYWENIFIIFSSGKHTLISGDN